MQYTYAPHSLPFRPLVAANNAPTRWYQPPPAYPTTSPLPQSQTAEPFPFPSAWHAEPQPQVSTLPLALPPRPPSAPSTTTSATRTVKHDSEASSVLEPQKVIEDVELGDPEETDGEDGMLKGQGSLNGQSTEDLKLARFNAVWAEKAPDGLISMDNLPALLSEAGVNSSAEDVSQAMLKVMGHTSHMVDYDRAAAVYRRLAFAADASSDDAGDEEAQGGRFKRWAATLSDSKATNVLLAIVTALSCFSAFLAAGLAIALMMESNTSTLNTHMFEDIGTIRDIFYVFQEHLYIKEVNFRASEIAELVAAVTQGASYKTTLVYNLNAMSFLVAFAAEAIGAWWGFQQEKSFVDTAYMMGLFLETAINAEGRDAALNMVNSMQSGFPEGIELLVGEWTDDTNTSLRFLTDFRFKGQCQSGVCESDAHATYSSMKAALSGVDGAIKSLDYRPREVYVGYTSIAGVGVEYKLDADVTANSKFNRIRDFFNAQNLGEQNSREFFLGRVDDRGNALLLTQLRSCDASCVQHVTRPTGPLGKALARQSGVMELIGYHGKPVLAAYAPIPGTSMALVVQALKEESVAIIMEDIAKVTDFLNTNLLFGTEELEASRLTVENGTRKVEHLSKHKFEHECDNTTGCLNTTGYLELAMDNCSQGVTRTTDYRGEEVVAGYSCMAEMNVVVSMKMDMSEVNEMLLDNAVQYINDRNVQDEKSNDEFMLARRNPGLTAQQVKGFDDFQLLTTVKKPESCLKAGCAWDSNMLLRTVQNKPGDLPAIMSDVDYAGRSVMGALNFDESIGGGIALAMEKHSTDYTNPVVETAIKVVSFTIGIVLVATGVLIFTTKRMMRTMIAASDEGKLVVERERQQFSALVGSMYPAYVVPRLLAGERHIVAQVKHAAVFFSDIYEFTSASNTISPEELLQFLGYTYGVMDDIADRYHIYKVKTVGDAYLAVSGLPGSETKDCCLDMLRFASCVAQVFSHRFNHPEKGKVLEVIANTMSWNRRRRRVVAASKGAASEPKSKGSVAPVAADGANSAWTGKSGTEVESTHHTQSVVSGSSRPKAGSVASRSVAGAPQVQCIMSYGIATGPVTAGVLQGKSPIFDIWGKTVNLASRMESTGQPGRIQVSEQFFRKVALSPNQPFAFEPGHKAYCKGFGAVNSYYVRSTAEPPPKDLMEQLGLEPRFGLFYFDNVLNGILRHRQNVAAPQRTKLASDGPHSETSSQKADPHVADPHIPHHNAADFMDVEDM